MVATIGGKLNRPTSIGTVEWTWDDDNGTSRTQKFEKCIYFPSSPINIMSVTSYAKQLGDEDGTGIDTKMKYSRFYWKNNQYSRQIFHSASNLPELAINEGNKPFSWFSRAFSLPTLTIAAAQQLTSLKINQFLLKVPSIQEKI